jgi:predicted aconitase with swiveling domain
VSASERMQRGRIIYPGRAAGRVLKSTAPLSFFGGFDLERGVVTERSHPLENQCVSGRVLVFPTGTGSTVGSFALLRMARAGVGPAALLMRTCDTIVAVGAIIAEIPCVDQIDIDQLRDDEAVQVVDSEVHFAGD